MSIFESTAVLGSPLALILSTIFLASPEKLSFHASSSWLSSGLAATRFFRRSSIQVALSTRSPGKSDA